MNDAIIATNWHLMRKDMFNIFCGASASSPFKTKHDIASYEIDLIDNNDNGRISSCPV